MRFQSPTPLGYKHSFYPERQITNLFGFSSNKRIGESGPDRVRASRRVLVVDDNADSRELTATLVQMSGHESRTASDGGEAIEQANRYQPDAILLDIGLPDMSGYDVCRTIREQDWASEVPIIALSGWDGSEALDESREAGFDAHLVKPVDPADLLDLLSTLS
jgi:CheY-like chemotaxis protein